MPLKVPKLKSTASRGEKVAAAVSFAKAELVRALKVARSFEKQKLTKRLREARADPDRARHVVRETEVLTNLDLHKLAHERLCISLLWIKAVATSPDLPDEIRNGVAEREDISGDQRVLTNNIVSILSNRDRLRRALDRATAAVCDALGVPVPATRAKGRRRLQVLAPKKEDGTSQVPVPKKEGSTPQVLAPEKGVKREMEDGDGDDEEGENSGPAKKKPRSEPRNEQPEDVEDVDKDDGRLGEMDEGKEEAAVSRLDERLGGSDADDSDSGSSASPELDPMEITSGEESDGEDLGGNQDDPDVDSEKGSFRRFSDPDRTCSSSSDDDELESKPRKGPAPQPSGGRKVSATKEPKRQKKAAAAAANTLFLSSLMSGYISGSESASEIEELAPPRKNRRGQRARQEIWEIKFKANAKHLQKSQQQQGGSKRGGRDAGWDPTRGAVDEGAEGGSRGKPWKGGGGARKPPPDQQKRGKNGAGHQGGGGNAERYQAGPASQQGRPNKAKDDAGPLHPSWEAKKKLKETKPDTAAFQGKKTTFN